MTKLDRMVDIPLSTDAKIRVERGDLRGRELQVFQRAGETLPNELTKESEIAGRVGVSLAGPGATRPRPDLL